MYIPISSTIILWDLGSCLCRAALWSPVGKGQSSWLSCMWCFLVYFSLSHVVSWVRCDCIDSWSLPSSLLLLQVVWVEVDWSVLYTTQKMIIFIISHKTIRSGIYKEFPHWDNSLKSPEHIAVICFFKAPRTYPLTLKHISMLWC